MKNIKMILTTACISFTMVILINTFLGVFINNQNLLSTTDILEVAFICLMVSIGIAIVSSHHILKEYGYFLSYILMLCIVFLMEFIFKKEFSWINIGLEIIFLTLVFLAVSFLTYFGNEKDAMIINKKLKYHAKSKQK